MSRQGNRDLGPVQILTSKVKKDFSVAVKKFIAQYQQKVEARLHQKQVHDRVIVVDDTDFMHSEPQSKTLARN
jgi:hypothetical protein